MTPEALANLYQLRLDGLSDHTARAIMADIDAVLVLISGRLSPRTGVDTDTFRYDRYAALRVQLATLREALRVKIGDHLGAALDATVSTVRTVMAREFVAAESGTFDFGAGAFGATVPHVAPNFAMLPLEALLAVKDVPHDGFSWTRWGQRLADGVLSRVEGELRQSFALGEPTRETAKRLATVADLSRASAQRLARTAITATQNRARMAQWQTPNVRSFADGWRFSAVLDGRVSAVCASLHGKIFSLDDAGAPFPPRHPHCRSTTMLVWKAGAGRFDRAYYEGRETGEDWLKKQPEVIQREVLGAAGFRAFQHGVPLSGAVTYDRPLTATQLRALYPEGVAA